MWLLGMEKMNGLRLQHFLKEKEGTESFKEIPIIIEQIAISKSLRQQGRKC